MILSRWNEVAILVGFNEIVKLLESSKNEMSIVFIAKQQTNLLQQQIQLLCSVKHVPCISISDFELLKALFRDTKLNRPTSILIQCLSEEVFDHVKKYTTNIDPYWKKSSITTLVNPIVKPVTKCIKYRKPKKIISTKTSTNQTITDPKSIV
jgi:ribosomal protein L7Ae-like RNA K-turn-binding protein